MTLAIELAKLCAVASVFAITIPALMLGKWLMLGGYHGVQFAGRIVGWRR